MGTNHRIPIYSNAAYTYWISIEEKSYQMTVHWNDYETAFFMDLLGYDNDVDVKGIKLVSGANLLKPYAISDLGAMYLLDTTGQGEDPTFNSLENNFALYYVDSENTDAII